MSEDDSQAFQVRKHLYIQYSLAYCVQNLVPLNPFCYRIKCDQFEKTVCVPVSDLRDVPLPDPEDVLKPDLVDVPDYRGVPLQDLEDVPIADLEDVPIADLEDIPRAEDFSSIKPDDFVINNSQGASTVYPDGKPETENLVVSTLESVLQPSVDDVLLPNEENLLNSYTNDDLLLQPDPVAILLSELENITKESEISLIQSEPDAQKTGELPALTSQEAHLTTEINELLLTDTETTRVQDQNSVTAIDMPDVPIPKPEKLLASGQESPMEATQDIITTDQERIPVQGQKAAALTEVKDGTVPEEILVQDRKAPVPEEVLVQERKAPVPEQTLVQEKKAPVPDDILVQEKKAPVPEEILVQEKKAPVPEEILVQEQEAVTVTETENVAIPDQEETRVPEESIVTTEKHDILIPGPGEIEVQLQDGTE